MKEYKEYPVEQKGDYYLSIETEHFYFDVYKAWNGTGGGAMFRAGSYIKKNNGNRKYYIDYALFAEWDYKDKQEAFDNAVDWVYEYIDELTNELKTVSASYSQVKKYSNNAEN